MKRIIGILMVTAVATIFLNVSASGQSDSLSAKIDSAADTSGQTAQISPAPADTTAAGSLFPITPERREMLNKYSNFSLGWSVFYDIFDWLLLLILAFSGASFWLLKLAERISSKPWAHFLLFMFGFMLVTSVITLPLDIYRDYFVEHQYNLSNQSFGAWSMDWLKAFPITYIISAIAIAFLYFLVRKFPRRWWLYFSLGAIPFVIFLMVISPVVISPIFNKFQPLQNQELKTEILNLAEKAGISGANVFQVDASKQSKKLNAYVAGLFGTKRIVLYDTSIKAFTDKELLFVMAHEMGHYVMHHVWYVVAMVIVLIFILTWVISRVLPAIISKYSKRLGFDNLGSYASLPLIMFIITFISFFIQPATNGVSRYFEHQADKYGIEMTNYDCNDAKVAFEKLSSYNLSDPNPNPIVEFWFYNHPALDKRIAFVESYKGKQ